MQYTQKLLSFFEFPIQLAHRFLPVTFSLNHIYYNKQFPMALRVTGLEKPDTLNTILSNNKALLTVFHRYENLIEYSQKVPENIRRFYTLLPSS